ncbi:chalcone isomerase family protein [Vibrio gangliei]|uniref:chalcone isomerase family protein n=1 Tax=Vibrio gangliei TaxID=2077090 RepID=UPI000D021508|nr:chalcone isomerase family protein [Vibrio gangliei]
MKWTYLRLVLFIIPIAIVLPSWPVWAKEDHFKLVGEARMTHLFWDIYDAKLYTKTGTFQRYQPPIKFSLTYLRNIKAKDIVSATNQQWEHLGQNGLIGKYDQQLLSMWPDINQGDSLTLLVNDKGISKFYYNQKKVGEIQDSNFSEQFLAIWLSPNTSEPDLRAQLIKRSE